LKTEQISAAFDKYIKPVVEVAAVEPTKVTARLENLVEGECPYCHQKMMSSNAAGVEVWVCHSDRAVCPKLNEGEEAPFELKPTI
jgi:hypothetical protein